MRVALICPYDLGVFGGVQDQSLCLARALTRGGDDVLVCAPGDGVAPGVATASLGPSLRVPANGSVAPVALHPRVLRRLADALGRFRPDVVHVEEPFAPLASLGALVLGRAPRVGTFHRSGSGGGYRLLGPALRPLAARLGAMTVVSEAARATLAAVIGPAARAALVVPNGIELPPLLAPRPPGRPEIAFVGRLEVRKGCADLVAAVRTSTLDARLSIIGDGPERDALERQAAGDERISFLGALRDEDKVALLARADVFAAPARGGESFGVVLLEAMAAGAAVCASDLPGYREAGGDVACYVSPGDVAGWRDALERLSAGVDERRVRAAAGRARAEQFSMDAFAARYRQLYDEVRTRSRRAGASS